MEYYVKHLSAFTEMKDILQLINNVAGKKVVPASKYHFLKFFDEDIDYSFYASCKNEKCKSIIKIKPGSNVKSVICRNVNCKRIETLESVNVAFVTFELEKQLKQLLERFKDTLILPDKPLPKFPIIDVWNCDVHSEIILKNKEPFISLTLNTDGVQIFKSNSISLWPIILSVNNLPLNERFKQDNLIICGFHHNSDLDIASYLEDLISEVQKINSSGGLQLSFGKFKVFCLLSSLDAPAKSKVQNMVQYNGYFGCPYCLDEGKFIDGCVRFSAR